MRTSNRKSKYSEGKQTQLGKFVPHNEPHYILTPKGERLQEKILAKQKKDKS